MKAKQTPKNRTHNHPPYSEHGPVWTVCPIERSEELGRTTNYLVVDLDYDRKNYTGACMAECGSWDKAVEIADSLNERAGVAARLEALEELFSICKRVPPFSAFPKIPDFSGERDRFMLAMAAAEKALNS